MPSPGELLPLHDISVEEFVDQIDIRIMSYRAGVRASASKILPTMILPHNNRFTGEAYVEREEAVVSFKEGGFPNYYEAGIVRTRDASLGRLKDPREKAFTSLAAGIPENKRILNVGAGGDVVPIQAYLEAGHEVISTDFSQNVVDILKGRVSAPGFACDLVNLKQFVPENSIDVLIGNSVMGYLNIDKVSDVVENLESVMKEGAVFTFDLTPHPSYFTILKDNDEKSVVNDSAPDPAVLIRLMNKYGIEEGLRLMSHYQFAINCSVQGGTMLVLKDLFEEKGWTVKFGVRTMDTNINGAKLIHTLRIGKSEESEILHPVEDDEEFVFTEFNKAYWDYIKSSQPRSIYSLFCIDRYWADKLSEVIGRKMTTWEIIDYVEKNQGGSASIENVNEVLQDISPENVYAKLIDYVRDKKPFPDLKELSELRMLEQVLHKQAYLGEGKFAHLSEDMVTTMINAKYSEFGKKEKIRKVDKVKKARAQKQHEKNAKAKRNAKKSRKKGRR